MMDNISDVDSLNSIPSYVVMESLSILHLLNHGWAHRQNQGKMHGDTLIAKFKDGIDEVFERGECDKG